jgi:hypothetical protein
MACYACGGDRWLHSSTDTGPEVEACDTCTGGPGREERAIQLHRIMCGCLWPENREDEPGETFYGGRTQMAVATFEPIEGMALVALTDAKLDDNGYDDPESRPEGKRAATPAEFSAPTPPTTGGPGMPVRRPGVEEYGLGSDGWVR